MQRLNKRLQTESTAPGFLADYESGEITLQESEIYDAQWFSYDPTLARITANRYFIELVN